MAPNTGLEPAVTFAITSFQGWLLTNQDNSAFKWCGIEDSNLHAFASAPKADASTNSANSAN